MRGEHVSSATAFGKIRGSSPHARGARISVVQQVATAGIIPACAGSTCSMRFPPAASRDHPRMRGEHTAAPFWMPDMRGSSPHARGALTNEVDYQGKKGIIPACAGSTNQDTVLRLIKEDHPRMRGEHIGLIGTMSRCQGSSPHARGALTGRKGQSNFQGIIPACAGST